MCHSSIFHLQNVFFF
uniref:Uncharacterized protein n=1 Tax=Anguilla anguilla TaxID=7936 RepID=A0A0E9V9A0_ANGAN